MSVVGKLPALLQTYGWRVVKVEMAFLDTLTVDTLGVGKTEETLLEKVTRTVSVCTHIRWLVDPLLFLVPEGKGDILQTVGIGDTGDTIFTPTVSTLAGHVMGEVCQDVSF